MQSTRPSRAEPRGRVALLAALSAFGPLSMDMYLPALPELTRDLGASASAAQLTLTTCMIGLGVGQIVIGPISDARGRRGPLLTGVALYAVASALCALAPGIWTLLALRFAQGVAGAAGIVVARAIVSDLYRGAEAVRYLGLLILVSGVVPMFAPLIGGQLLHVTDWRGIFGILALTGLLLLVASWRILHETAPPPGEPVPHARVFGVLLRDRRFMGHTLAAGLSVTALIAYIAGSPFVLQDIHGVSPQAFSVIFAVNSAGIVAATQITRGLVERFGAERLLRAGLWLGALGAAGTLAAVATGSGLLLLLPALFVAAASVGVVLPTGTALALADHPQAAGAASGMLGVAQFGFGAAIAPLVGLGGTGDALPMGIAMAVVAVCALLAGQMARTGYADRVSEQGMES